MSAIINFRGFVRERGGKLVMDSRAKTTIEPMFLIVPDIEQWFEPVAGYQTESNVVISKVLHDKLQIEEGFALSMHSQQETYFLTCFYLTVWLKNGDEVIYLLPTLEAATKLYEEIPIQIEDFYKKYKDYVSYTSVVL